MPKPKLSAKDNALYRELIYLLHGLQYTATHNFHEKKSERKEIVEKLRAASTVFVEKFGCGNLCEDKNGGCVPCYISKA